MAEINPIEPVELEDQGITRFVERSPRRVAVLERLQRSPARRSQVGAFRGVGSTANATAVLDELHDNSLVERLVTEDEVAYGLTKEGELALFDVRQRREE